MTNPTMDMTNAQVSADAPDAPTSHGQSHGPSHAAPRSPYAHPLPHVRVGTISGLLELIVDKPQAREDVADLAERLALPMGDLLPILDAAVMLQFATVENGEVALTDVGRDFATTTILRSKDVFRQQLLAHAPIVATISKTLEQKENKSMRADFFVDLLDEYYPREEAKHQFDTAVEWGRYAELFEYDADDGVLSVHENAIGA